MIDGESGEKTFETLVKSQDEVRWECRQLDLQKEKKPGKSCEMVKRCLFCKVILYHLDLLVLLAYSKINYVVRKRKIVLFLWCLINQSVVDEVLHSVDQEMDPAYLCV